MLSQILSNMCKALGVKVKTSHSPRVTCTSALFQNGVEKKLIRERTGYRSDALRRYEKSSVKQKLFMIICSCISLRMILK